MGASASRTGLYSLRSPGLGFALSRPSGDDPSRKNPSRPSPEAVGPASRRNGGAMLTLLRLPS